MKIRKSTWLLVAICFISCCAFATRPNVWAQLAAMLTILAAIVYLVTLVIQAMINWREKALINFLSCLLIILSVPVAIFSGHKLRSVIFAYNLDRWNQAVVWVVSHGKPNQGTLVRLPTQYSDLARGVHYKYEKSCGIMVDFFWGGGFPVKHTVRRYAKNPSWVDIKQCRADWSRGRTLSSNWYEISD
jgi:hypothetical protein